MGEAAAQEVPMQELFVGLRHTREAWRGAVVPTEETFAEDSSPKGTLRSAQRIGELRPAAVLVQALGGGELPVVVALLETGRAGEGDFQGAGAGLRGDRRSAAPGHEHRGADGRVGPVRQRTHESPGGGRAGPPAALPAATAGDAGAGGRAAAGGRGRTAPGGPRASSVLPRPAGGAAARVVTLHGASCSGSHGRGGPGSRRTGEASWSCCGPKR